MLIFILDDCYVWFFLTSFILRREGGSLKWREGRDGGRVTCVDKQVYRGIYLFVAIDSGNVISIWDV